MASYGTNDGFESWVTSQGLSLPEGANLDQLRSVGSAYIDAAYEWRLSCSSRAGGFSQELAWPRTGHTVNGQEVPSDLIPAAWINASYRAAYLNGVTAGWSTNTSDPNRVTKREKVDVLEREFFAAGDNGGKADTAAGMPSDAIINGMVLPWLCSSVRGLNTLFRVV